MSLKNFLSKSLSIFTSVASAASIAGYYSQYTDELLKKNFVKIQKENEILRDQINEFKMDELKNELAKSKVETLRSSLEICNNKISNEVEQINKLEANNKELLEPHLKNINKEGDNINSTINEIIEIFNDLSNKFFGDSNLIEKFKLFINKWNDFISSLNLEQVGLVAHITTSIFIIVCLLNILSVLMSDFLIKYFELEKKFPKLSIFLQLRRKFQTFYLILNFFLIFITLITLIYIDFRVLLLIL